MGKKLQKYLDEAEKTEQQIEELEERLRTIRAAQKKEEDSEIIRAIRSTKMGGRELRIESHSLTENSIWN